MLPARESKLVKSRNHIDVFCVYGNALDMIVNVQKESLVIAAHQLRAARALLEIDQKTMAEMAGVSLPTIQRMEASQGNVRGIVNSVAKVIDALNHAGIELLSEHTTGSGSGRGVRFRHPGGSLQK